MTGHKNQLLCSFIDTRMPKPGNVTSHTSSRFELCDMRKSIPFVITFFSHAHHTSRKTRIGFGMR